MLLAYIAGIAMYIIGVVTFSAVAMRKAKNEPEDDILGEPLEQGDREWAGVVLGVGLMICPIVNFLMGCLAFGLAMNDNW